MGSCKMIALVVTLSILVLSTSATCPDKWLDASFVEMGCLFFNNTAAVDWEEANVICEKYSNATLVDIQTEMQMGFLQMELDVIANAEGAEHGRWTAGTDVGREGQWYWATTLEEVGDFIWFSNMPDGGTTGNCIML